MTWQLICTAPTDRMFLAYRNGDIRDAEYIEHFRCENWRFGNDGFDVFVFPHLKPTHWMPLPDPPK